MKTTVTTMINNSATKPKSAFTQLVERLYAEKTNTIGNQGTLASVIGTCFASMSQVQHTWKRAAFRDMLLHLEAQGCYALLRDEVYITTLANIAAFGNKLVREIDTWEKESFVAENQISALIKHCFARYEVPEFLESVFYGDHKIQMLWYVQLGRGESVLSLSGFPVKFTKKMAHEFKKAPASYTVERAIRWAQTKGYGATDLMAETLAWSTLSEHFENEDFWITVIAFFAKFEELPYAKVQEVLSYIKVQFEADKTYVMKGRTWEALVKQSDDWHAEYYKRMHALNRAEWTTSPIKGFRKSTVENEKNIEYYIIELVNSEALYEEGYEMSHCVAEYEYECIEGRAAIFSLRKKVAEVVETLATLEVELAIKTIVQAKAKYNEAISKEAHEIVTAWATIEKLTLGFDECGDFYAEEHEVHFPAEARAVQYNAPQNNYRAQRTNHGEINWKFVLFVVFLVFKACSALNR
ncbi:hypothetical protein HKT18_02885 [Flavobacterium sp. IMCC34852]|uniref:Uncharacterized protein n=1 Tax=Flavobacterium rivulicola TaxID=2732161 RepID=A0A7Y3R750_9FLAO|nr:PcfJ domain-containing protein [Flavobacterium sp. IMCC34852]NNT71153.1 hypothetical protein [Flavobacterium sp. IMCC34852]